MNVALEQVRVRVGGFDLAIDVRLEAHVTAVFGPSGAGKTTLLDVIAGLRRSEGGRVRLGGVVLSDAEAGVWVPPHRRRIGYVPQDLALFPHYSVRENLMYGARRAGAVEGNGHGVTLGQVSALLEIAGLLERRIASLSGGERQRVALGRALLSQPRLLVLDEPMASLDTGLKGRILPYLRRIRETMRLPILHVSHDPAEVRALCDEVLVLERGRVVRRGSPGQVLV